VDSRGRNDGEKKEKKKSTSLKLYTDDYTDALLCTQRGSSIEKVGLGPAMAGSYQVGKIRAAGN